jgi:squalene-hopene/tetraprenyl-beta-curcumene cyclase
LRHGVALGGLAALLGWLGCAGPADPPNPVPAHAPVPERTGRIDRALNRAARFLLGRQSHDGAWRSDIYGSFRDGTALTPLVLGALRSCPCSPRLTRSCRKGTLYLAARARPDGTIDEGKYGFSYPVYTSAGAVLVLGEQRKARAAWLGYLRQRQLTEDLGWQPADKEYGGWGFSNRLPRTPPEEALTESNLSATVFALEALLAAGLPTRDPPFAKALTFVRRCQNYADDPKRRDPAFDDGGFFFIYDDADRNKAGAAGKDRWGRPRFRSYGSATADGLRCLLACGLPAGHPRVRAARNWLRKNFSARRTPGRFGEDDEVKRQGVYYYYAWSVARALYAGGHRTGWVEALADELMKR